MRGHINITKYKTPTKLKSRQSPAAEDKWGLSIPTNAKLGINVVESVRMRTLQADNLPHVRKHPTVVFCGHPVRAFEDISGRNNALRKGRGIALSSLRARLGSCPRLWVARPKACAISCTILRWERGMAGKLCCWAADSTNADMTCSTCANIA